MKAVKLSLRVVQNLTYEIFFYSLFLTLSFSLPSLELFPFPQLFKYTATWYPKQRNTSNSCKVWGFSAWLQLQFLHGLCYKTLGFFVGLVGWLVFVIPILLPLLSPVACTVKDVLISTKTGKSVQGNYPKRPLRFLWNVLGSLQQEHICHLLPYV